MYGTHKVGHNINNRVQMFTINWYWCSCINQFSAENRLLELERI